MAEFVEWNMENAEVNPDESEAEMKELARSIFAIFDEDNSGEVTVGEFSEALNKMNSGLTIEEIAAIVADFDEDGSGSISLAEFEDVIEKAVRGN
jgi:Ca2+-binding EF-hand superfamily protein